MNPPSPNSTGSTEAHRQQASRLALGLELVETAQGYGGQALTEMMATKEPKGHRAFVSNRLRAYRRNEAVSGTKGIFVFFCG
jgi:hypothetical protein